MTLAVLSTLKDQPRLVSNGLAGYISMSVPAPPEGFGYGVSLYAAAWPLVEGPIRDFQIGLASIWIVPDNRKINEPLLPKGTIARDNWPERGPSYRDVFQTIEGGLGFWASTRFGSATAKFRMNGTANGYNHEISSPGWGFGDTKVLRADQMGIAQLSSRILVPPDGMTFQKNTVGELLGYAWMALPLTNPRSTTAGLPIPTGNQCWTLFLNSANFRGPVAFYTPSTWSRISRQHPPAVGRGLDARPGLVTGGAIEINTVPRFVAKDADGATYTKIPKLQFPVDKDGRTVLIHNLTHYSRGALYNQVESWLAGGEMPSGRFDPSAAVVPAVEARPLSVRQGEKNVPILGTKNWVETSAWDGTTFGLKWTQTTPGRWGSAIGKGTFLEYCRESTGRLEAVSGKDVPSATGLTTALFPPSRSNQSYESGSAENDEWHVPGAVTGPLTARLSDGSYVTYAWYLFIDQPSMRDVDLDPQERWRLQQIVEKIHRQWTPKKEYLPPPKTGKLAALDSSMFVTPPKGLEFGYVPIVIRQSATPPK